MNKLCKNILCLLVIGAFIAISSVTWAWETYHNTIHDPQDTVGSCAGAPTDNCHPGFNSGNPGDSHGVHSAITQNCLLCHTGATPPGLPNNNPFTMWSVGSSDPPDTYGCTGCHGRDYGETIKDHYDNDGTGSTGPTPPFLIKGLSKMSGYGLRKFHVNSVPAITDCLPCHVDMAQSLIKAENIAPPYYSRADVNLDPCTDNLDNDGDGLRDAADPDCQSVAPDIRVTDSSLPANDLQLPFGSMLLGTSRDLSVTVKNVGNAALVLGTVAASDPLLSPFSVLSDDCSGVTLAPAENCLFNLRFAPIILGSFNDSLDIPSNDTDENPVTVTVSGTGILVAEPDINVIDSVPPSTDLSVPFGSVDVGTTSGVQGVTVANNGTAGLLIGNVADSNPLSSPFIITTDSCSGQFLPVASSCIINLRIAPTAAGLASNSFDIPSNDPDENPVTVSVSGNGIDAGGGGNTGGGGGPKGGGAGCSIIRGDEGPLSGALSYIILILAALSFTIKKRK